MEEVEGGVYDGYVEVWLICQCMDQNSMHLSVLTHPHLLRHLFRAGHGDIGRFEREGG